MDSEDKISEYEGPFKFWKRFKEFRDLLLSPE